MARKRLTFFVSEELFNWIEMIAEAKAQSKSELLNEILEEVKESFEEDELDAIADEIYAGTNWFMLDEN